MRVSGHGWWLALAARVRIALSTALQSEYGVSTMMVAFAAAGTGATLFASTMLSSAELSFDALAATVQGSVERVSGSLEVRGAIVGRSEEGPHADSIELTLGSFGSFTGVGLAPGAPGTLVINYYDDRSTLPNVAYSYRMLSGDEDAILEPGELALLHVYLPEGVLMANDRFTLELLSPAGGTLILSRRLPPVLQPVMPLP